jgi:hypothetical protein
MLTDSSEKEPSIFGKNRFLLYNLQTDYPTGRNLMPKPRPTHFLFILFGLIVALLGVRPGVAFTHPQPSTTNYLDGENMSILDQVGGHSNAVAIDGHIAYVGIGTRLWMFDISNPETILPLAQTPPLPGIVEDIVIQNNVAVVAAGVGGVHLIDVSDPFSPHQIGFFDTEGRSMGVDVVGDLIYVADSYSGLRILDATNPAGLVEIGFNDDLGNAWDVAVGESIAFIVDKTYYAGALFSVDVSDPTNPTKIGSIIEILPTEVELIGHIAFLLSTYDYGVITAIDVSDPTSPSRLDWMNVVGYAAGATISGNYAYLGVDDYGLRVVDVSDPTELVEVGSLVFDSAGAVALSGGTAYVTDLYGGLHAISIADPIEPHLLSSFDTMGESRNVAVAGDLAYLAGRREGLWYLYVTNPVTIEQINLEPESDWVYDVAVNEHIVYLATGQDGLRILDVSDPSEPNELGSYQVENRSFGTVVVDGNTAFLPHHFYIPPTQFYALRLVDVSDPTNPVQSYYTHFDWLVEDIVVADNIAYITSGYRLWIMDISDSYNPSFLGNINLGNWVYGVAYQGGMVYVAVGGDGLKIVDVTDPENPTIAGSFDTPAFARHVAIIDSTAFVSEYGSIRAIDISDPSDLRQIGFINLPIESTIVSSSASVERSGGVIYAAGLRSGLSMIQFHGIVGVSVRTMPSSSVLVPACGGTVAFDVTLTNHNDGPYTLDAWLVGVLPNGNEVGPLVGPQSVTLGPGQSVTRGLSVDVPDFAPTGDYQLVARLGTYPDAHTSAEFSVKKLETPCSEETPVAAWVASGTIRP